MKKYLALLIAAVVLTASCVPKTKSVSGALGGASDFQGLNFSWHISYDWYSAAHWANEKDGEKWIRDNYGVEIKFLDSGGDANQKLATFILDNEYPDVITLDRDANLLNLIAIRAVLPLDGYLEKYGNLRKYLGDGTLNLLRAADGKLYSFPNWASPIGNLSGNAGWLVQQKYYNELGRPELKTYDDLYAYLKALKEAYPNVTPLSLNAGFSSNAVIYGGMKAGNNPGYIHEHLFMDNGTLKTSLEDPSYQKTLLFINKLYRERLVAQDLFIMNDDRLQEMVRNGLVGVLCLDDIFDSSGVIEPNMELAAENPSFNLLPVNPIVKAGVRMEDVFTNFSNAAGWNVNVITKDAKEPEKIFALLDWMFGNVGQLVLTLGVPGKYWIPGEYSPEGYPEMTDAFFTATNEEIDAEWCDSNWVGNTVFVDNLAKYVYEKTGVAQQLKLDQFNYTWNHSVDSTELTHVQPELNSDMGVLWQNIDGIYAQAIPEIVLASSEAASRAAINKYIAQLRASGLQRLLDYQFGILNDNLVKIGKK
jgi:ABC-type glycerol-3-phosphate transport system substrate-binding protein